MKTSYQEYRLFWIFVIIKQVLSSLDSTCYCLKEELSALRNPLHIEPAVLGGEQVYLIAEQLGVIKVYNPTSVANKLITYIDITDRVVSKPELYEERGLLGFALHPKFENNQKLYAYTIRPIDYKDYVVVSEITEKDVTKEKILMVIEQPGTRRNGGQMLFGDDGYLYIFVGDGGPTDDKDIQAQTGDNLLGKILRIDVDLTTVVDNHIRYYDIPQDNPKRSNWRPEVYAVGTRNMWRCSKDSGDTQGRGKGRIFCGDLGSSLADELIELKKGANYGWPYWEGNICRNSTMCQQTANDIVSPIYEFRQNLTQMVLAVVGGPLYRGALFPELYGQLVYGDYVSGKQFTLKEPSSKDIHSYWTSKEFARCVKSTCGCDAHSSQRTMLLSFGQTHDGELLILMTDEPTPSKPRGALLRLLPQRSKDMTCGVESKLPGLWMILVTCSVTIFSYYFLCSARFRETDIM